METLGSFVHCSKSEKIMLNKMKTKDKTLLHLQSKCFFFGPIISSVVALQTAFANPCPAKLCRAANNLSCSVCPPAVCMLYYEIISETSQTQIK